jgi:hypothetical protein
MTDGESRAFRLVARGSRRGALWAGVAGLAAVVGGAGPDRVAAREEAPSAAPPTSYLFVQSFGAGTLAPATEQGGMDNLTLAGGVGWTVYFADRPERAAGVAPTEEFLAELAAGRGDPPNAALVRGRSGGAVEPAATIWVVTLFAGTYDAAADTLTYQARVVAPTVAEAGRFTVTPAAAPAAPVDLRAGYLFIDPVYVPGEGYDVTRGMS